MDNYHDILEDKMIASTSATGMNNYASSNNLTPASSVPSSALLNYRSRSSTPCFNKQSSSLINS